MILSTRKGDVEQRIYGATNFLIFFLKIFQGITSMKAFNMLMKLCTYQLLTVVTSTFE